MAIVMFILLLPNLIPLLNGIISVAYNIATNTNTYKNTSSFHYSINPLNCSKLLGLSTTTDIA